MTTALITHPDCMLHEMGALHPESPYRLRWVETALRDSGLYERMVHHQAPSVSDEDLLRVHDHRHLDALHELVPREGYVRLDLETMLNPKTMDSVSRAAGANARAVELVMSGEADSAFCCVRPPGHHAEHDRPVGFCFVNNLAVGAAKALAYDEIERIAIVDFDVHHGNGTEDIFYDDPRVMICSTFQALLLPRRLFEEHEDRIINIPLDAGSGSEAFRKAVTDHWLPALERFEPDIIFISAGFDAHWMDTVSGIYLTEQDFGWVTEEIKRIARKSSRGRMISSLEGGYQFTALGPSVREHVQALMS